MRLFESILLLILVMLIYQLVFSKQKDKQPMQLLFFALILIVVQVMFEGYRWQMVPTYLSFGILYLRLKIGELKFTQRFNKFAWGLWALFTVGLPVVSPVFSLPQPTGPFLIGTKLYHWIDQTRPEWFTPNDENPNDLRELLVQVWYPVEKVTGKPVPYLYNLNIRADGIGAAGGFPGFLVSHIDLVKTHSFLNETTIQNKQFPLLILSHGITGYKEIHTALIEELTSHGYVVAAPDHTYDCNLTVFPDGHIADYRSDITGYPDSVQIRRQQLNTRVADIRFILDQMLSDDEFHNVIDFDKVGVLGHSYGGSTAIQAAYEDSRIKAVLALDSWMNPIPELIIEQGISQPFLHLGRPHWDDSEYPTSPARLVRFLKNVRKDGIHYTLQGARHLDFSDVPLYSTISNYLLETGSVAPLKTISIVNKVVVSFFDKFLKNKSNQFPDNLKIFQELLKH